MENLLDTDNKNSQSGLRILLRALTSYPLFWTLLVLTSGLLQSRIILMFAMLTWVVALFLGVITWLCLSIYLTVTKKISIKELILHLLVVAIGTLTAYFVMEYDVFNSGVKYID